MRSWRAAFLASPASAAWSPPSDRRPVVVSTRRPARVATISEVRDPPSPPTTISHAIAERTAFAAVALPAEREHVARYRPDLCRRRIQR
jgi:hypothetical protein